MSHEPFIDEDNTTSYSTGEATCCRCGTPGLEWVDIGGHKPRWQLYEGDRPHRCRQVDPSTSSDFEALP